MSDLDRQATGVPDAPQAERCEHCDGTGLVTIQYGGDGYGDKCCGLADADDQPCPECEGKGFIYG